MAVEQNGPPNQKEQRKQRTREDVRLQRNGCEIPRRTPPSHPSASRYRPLRESKVSAPTDDDQRRFSRSSIASPAHELIVAVPRLIVLLELISSGLLELQDRQRHAEPLGDEGQFLHGLGAARKSPDPGR